MSVLFKLKDHFKENQLYLNRTVAATIGIFLLLSILVGRLVYLQITQHDTYATLARNNQMRMLSVSPTRGLIYDRNGILLAENVPIYSLEVIPSRIKNLHDLTNRLSHIVPISEADIKAFKKKIKYKGRFESIPLREKLTDEEVALFSLEKYQFPDVNVVAHLSRNYPLGPVLSHVLGYIGPISEQDLSNIDIAKYRGTHVIGKLGLEKYYEELLHGKVGYEQVETDARGRIVRIVNQTLPSPGQNIYLSIDSKLQQLAYDELQNYQGSVVAIDVKTGGILTLVSKPSYNANLFINGIEQEAYIKLQQSKAQPLFHRAIKGQYPPGSIVKPLVAIQALEHNVIQPNTRIFDPGYYKLHDEGRLFRDWRPNGHGYVNLEHAIAESCTTFFYYVSDKLGIDRIYDIYSKFGLGQVTGIDLEGEAKGLAPSAQWKKATKNQNWFPGETLITGIGQGYTLVTPLQMAHITSIIANKGQILQPTLVKSTHTPGASPQEQPIKQVGNIKLSQEQNWNIIIKAMEQVIKGERGTARRINHPNTPYSIAGKTGTAQVFGLKQDETYDSEKIKESLRDHAWFVAFAPADDPQIAVAVLVEHGKGSSVIAKKLLDAYFKDATHG